jgi:hypothetical protein
MVVPSYELTRLDSHNFEHLVNALTLRVMGAGYTGFGPGPDGGRDGFFEGSAPYPSVSDNWSGRWYVQSKFHAANLSKDSQKWLLKQIKLEIEAFSQADSKRKIPDNWIIATNIDPSGVSETGCFDAAKTLVKEFSPNLSKRFHIWGGRKILDLLASNPEVSAYYYDFLTPGNILKKLFEYFEDNQANIDEIIRYLIVSQLSEQQYTKLEQAGSSVDNRPGIQRLFTDIPFQVQPESQKCMAAETLVKAMAAVHRITSFSTRDPAWQNWSRAPERARAWFIRGGPGQGKSTLTQYAAQIQRAAFVLNNPSLNPSPAQVEIAREIKEFSSAQSLWTEYPRVPVTVQSCFITPISLCR